jgi:hypothetical protein
MLKDSSCHCQQYFSIQLTAPLSRLGLHILTDIICANNNETKFSVPTLFNPHCNNQLKLKIISTHKLQREAIIAASTSNDPSTESYHGNESNT